MRPQGVRIYSVQAYDNVTAKPFWEKLATMSHGKHLNLSKMDTIVDMMMAICYREHGVEFFDVSTGPQDTFKVYGIS